MRFLLKKSSVYALSNEYAEQMSLIDTKIYKKVEGLLYYRIAPCTWSMWKKVRVLGAGIVNKKCT